MRSVRVIVAIGCWLGALSSAWAQNGASLFQQAQEAAEQQRYAQARAHCAAILQQEPQHWDARLLLTYTHAWEQHFDEATQLVAEMYTELQPLDAAPQGVLREVMLCDTQLAYWQSDAGETILRADRGIARFPEETEFWMFKGKAAMAQKDYETALKAFDETLALEPDHQEAQQLRDEAYWHLARYQAGVMYGHEIYTHSPFPRHTVSVELTRFWKKLTLTGRVNRSYRFDLVSQQAELEAWVELSKRWYLYAQSGYSDTRLFPRFRAGLEPFYKLMPSLEVSAGFRYLQYINQDVWIYTASVSKYMGRGLFMARTFWSPTPVGWRKSFEAGGRLFLPDEYNFIELKVGSGASPDNAYLDATYQELRQSRSLYTIVGGQKRFPRRWLGKVWCVIDHQMPTPGNNFSIISLNAGLWKRF